MAEKERRRYKTIIIGGGASGLLLSNLLPSSLVIERNSQCGLKLLITGSGKCNMTHDEESGEFIKHYYDKKRFVSSFIYPFPPEKIRQFFSSLELESYIRDDGKVFPVSERSEDVRNALLNGCRDIKYDTRVLSVRKEDENFIVETTNGTFFSNVLVIATGGKSYPETGSSGDGYLFAVSMGHRIIPPVPSLSPVRLSIDTSPIEGVSLPFIRIKAGGEKKAGPVVFTKNGISGPAAENISRFIQKEEEIEITFLEKITPEMIKTMNGRMNAVNALSRLTSLPHSLLLFLFPKIAEKNIATLRKEEISNITKSLTRWCVKALPSSFKRAAATRGGVDIAEIKAGTGESKLVENLYFAGEVMDVDGECGGYNLSFAFSSAHAVAEDIMKKS